MCDDDCGVSVGFDHREWRTARKAHECCVIGCDIPIRRGDRYHITTAAYEGTVSRSKHCARCWAICEALWKAGAGAIDLELNCGEDWVDNYDPKYGLRNEEPEHLAFMTADTAQRELVPQPAVPQ